MCFLIVVLIYVQKMIMMTSMEKNKEKLTHVSLFDSGSTNIICVAVIYNIPTVGFFVLYRSIIRTSSICTIKIIKKKNTLNRLS